MKMEFKKGDIVTWQIFKEQKPITAKIVNAVMDYDGFRAKEKTPVYTVEGISQPLVSVTSGKSIHESMYFKEPISEKDWFKS